MIPKKPYVTLSPFLAHVASQKGEFIHNRVGVHLLVLVGAIKRTPEGKPPLWASRKQRHNHVANFWETKLKGLVFFRFGSPWLLVQSQISTAHENMIV